MDVLSGIRFFHLCNLSPAERLVIGIRTTIQHEHHIVFSETGKYNKSGYNDTVLKIKCNACLRK